MNRSNVGNIVTNGMQILSVAGTTGAHEAQNARRAKLADASSGLNNLSEEERIQYGQMQANRIRDAIAKYNANDNRLFLEEQGNIGEMEANKSRADMSRYNAKGSSPFQHLSNEEASKYQSSVADKMRQSFMDVDEAMEGLEGPQKNELQVRISRDVLSSTVWDREGSAFKPTTIEDLINKRKENK